MFKSLFKTKKISETKPKPKPGRYNTSEIITRKESIKSLSLQSEMDGSISGGYRGSVGGFFLGFSGGSSGSINGAVKVNSYYHIYVKHHNKGYLLEKFDAESVFIKEIDFESNEEALNNEPCIEEKKVILVLDREHFNNEIYDCVYIDDKKHRFFHGMSGIYMIEEYGYSNKYYFIAKEEELKRLNLDNLIEDDKVVLLSKEPEITIYVPKGTILQKFDTL